MGADDDALALLGLPSDASADEIRAARRTLAKFHHPDVGGDAEEMQAVNEAADAALQRLAPAAGAEPPESPAESPPGSPPESPPESPPGSPVGWWSGVDRDIPSFTVEALPVETFEGLLVVASWIGEVLDDDPPYRLDTHLYEPVECWCRLDVVPDAGSSTVSLTIAGVDGAPTPDIVAVRDVWIANLNAVDWA